MKNKLTQKQIEIIVNTPITIDSFDMTDFHNLTARMKGSDKEMPLDFYWEGTVAFFDILRQHYVKTGNRDYLTELIRLLPNSYLFKESADK